MKSESANNDYAAESSALPQIRLHLVLGARRGTYGGRSVSLVVDMAPRLRVPIHVLLLWVFGVVLIPLTGCGKSSLPPATDSISQPPTTNELSNGTSASAAGCPIYSYNIINVWPHDANAFTQGLVFIDGALLESTGLNGKSTLRKVDLKTGQVLKQAEVPAQYFAEGLAVIQGRAFQLTWQNHKGFVYDVESFRLEREFAIEGEGWGLTTDGRQLVLSDGTDQIRFLDPLTFQKERTIHVRHEGRVLDRLNELEFIKGEIFANVWGSDYVVRIDPATGRVTGLIDFTGLLAAKDRSENTDVLNGIAYDSAEDRLFVTGKRWLKLFEVRLKLK
jgi:glutamine cyclotransferase